jgi:hypothetical protein
MVLLSAALQRKYRPDRLGNYPVFPSLTIGSELDGLFRVFRMAEAYFHQIYDKTEEAFIQHGVFVIPGASHGSFISGPLPPFVRLNDLKPEVDPAQVQAITARLISAFIGVHNRPSRVIAGSSLNARQRLLEGGRLNATYFQVIVKALQLEGSYHLKPACNYLPLNDERRDVDRCWTGSRWSEHAQQLMGQLESINFDVQDALWKVYLVNPVHLPAIHNSCMQPTKQCTLNITTVSQCVYDLFDELDTGFSTVSAKEIRVKMCSGQAVHISAGLKNANFTELDDNNHVCRDINQRAWQWALDNTPPSVMHRFYLHGSRLNMADDLKASNGGPGWIWGPLRMQRRYDWFERVWYFDVRAPNMRTPVDYPIKMSAGFHYCKLLSPARALEWIYTDSLKHPMR